MKIYRSGNLTWGRSVERLVAVFFRMRSYIVRTQKRTAFMATRHTIMSCCQETMRPVTNHHFHSTAHPVLPYLPPDLVTRKLPSVIDDNRPLRRPHLCTAPPGRARQGMWVGRAGLARRNLTPSPPSPPCQ